MIEVEVRAVVGVQVGTWYIGVTCRSTKQPDVRWVVCMGGQLDTSSLIQNLPKLPAFRPYEGGTEIRVGLDPAKPAGLPSALSFRGCKLAE